MISVKHVLKQLKKDLIGKDSYRGVSLTYAWLANQFGHFSLGFLPTIFLFCFYNFLIQETYVVSTKKPFLFGVSIAVMWFFFEILNFAVPLLKKKKAFALQWKNLIYDTLTDILFFTLGAFSASLTLELIVEEFEVTYVNQLVLIINVVTLLIPCKYWYSIRIFQQYAYLPFQFRLSQWNNIINAKQKNIVLDFLKCKSTGNHLLIFGGHHCGKTSLGVGIANELAIKFKKVTYTSAIKLSCFIVNNKEVSPLDLLWSWQEADLLIVDDINPGQPILEEIFTLNQFLNYLDSKKEYAVKNRGLIAQKNMIWVLGNQNIKTEKKWCSMLKDIGVPSDKIKKIKLC